MAFFDPFGGSGSGGSGGGSGAPGKDGRGISSIVFVSSTGGSIAGIAGATDTYKINYTDGTTSTYAIKNGNNGEQGIQGEQGPKGDKGDAGRSITRITTDDNNNVIVTFSDNTVQNIGQLDIDVQADFLTEGGFGNLRYYNGHFQKYDANSDAWVDTTATPDNVYIFNMVPQAMKKIKGVYDTDLCKYKIKFEEPDDTIIDGQLVCVIDKVIIRRKLGSAPENENDGDFIAEIKRREFGLYKNNWFVDNTLTPNLGDVYYYKVFPVSTLGHINYSAVNETRGLVCKEYYLYGFKINQSESDPASMITYLNDCDNYDYIPAHMDYTADTFDYGNWESAWFIEKLKPCMLKYDGTVDYELDKNDYTKKADGTASDVANTAYEGNAMVGVPKVYWKIVDNGDDTANVYISDKKIDNEYHCWSHIDNNGNEINYCYMPIYTGSIVDDKLRSLSGCTPMNHKSMQEGINYAKANNVGDDTIWYTEVFSDRKLIELLLILIGKSTDSQAIFGKGNTSGAGGVDNPGFIISGSLNNKGLFYGTQDNTQSVKVFGMENVWGNRWSSIAGYIYDNNVQKIKMTYGRHDGSTTDGYNIDGTGYISIENSMFSGAQGTYGGGINKMIFSPYGLLPSCSNGSTTTYYTDSLWYTNNSTTKFYAMTGGSGYEGNACGAMVYILNSDVTLCNQNTGESISCKPLANT